MAGDSARRNLVVIGIKYIMTYALCLYYNLKFAIAIAFLYLTQPQSRFWVPKERPNPPKCLLDPTLGEHKYATINGIKLHYVEKGDHSKPLMVFVHGFPEFWYSWRYQMREFANDYWVVAVDNRGYNESDKPDSMDDYDIDLITSDIKELVAHLGREKFTLVAHDWGAVIGWHYINKHMDTIEKYVFMDAPSREICGILFKKSWTQFRMSWYIFFFVMPCFPEFVLTLFDLRALEEMGKCGKSFTQDDLEAYKYVFSKKGAFKPPLDYYRKNFLMEDVVPQKPEKCARGLYLLGEHDAYICQESGPLLQKYYKNLDFKVVEGANHFVQQDKPEVVNQLMRKFLQSQS